MLAMKRWLLLVLLFCRAVVASALPALDREAFTITAISSKCR